MSLNPIEINQRTGLRYTPAYTSGGKLMDVDRGLSSTILWEKKSYLKLSSHKIGSPLVRLLRFKPFRITKFFGASNISDTSTGVFFSKLKYWGRFDLRRSSFGL